MIVSEPKSSDVSQFFTNEDFINLMMGSYANSAYVISTPVPADDTANASWFGNIKANAGNGYLMQDRNNYLAISTFTPDENGKIRRRSENFEALHCFYLDDIGTKYGAPLGFGRPTVMFETSPKNYQYWYKIYDPLRSETQALNFLEYMVNSSGSSDKIGDLSRVGRMLGWNNKKKYGDIPFYVKVVEVNPDAIYTVDDILAWKKLRRDVLDNKPKSLTSATNIEETPIYRALVAAGVATGKLVVNNTAFEVECFWKDKHSVIDDRPAAIFVHEDGTIGYKCFHSSCEGKTGFDVYSELSHKNVACSQLDMMKWANRGRNVFLTSSSTANEAIAKAPAVWPYIIDKLLPADVSIIAATGGMGKTTLTIYLAICFVLGRTVLGHEVTRQGSVLFITGEDNLDIFGRRFRDIIHAMNLTHEESLIVGNNIVINDLSDEHTPFVSSYEGNLMHTAAIDNLFDAYQKNDFKWVIIDPLIAFSAPEQFINDGPQMMITAARKIVKRWGCAVSLIHHVSKDTAKNNIWNMHAGRGGSALADGSRMMMQIHTHFEHSTDMPDIVDPHIFNDNRSVTEIRVQKLSWDKPPDTMWLVRDGYKYGMLEIVDPADGLTPEQRRQKVHLEVRVKQIEAIVNYVREAGDRVLTKTILYKETAAIATTQKVPIKRDFMTGLVDEAISKGLLVATMVHAGGKGKPAEHIKLPLSKF